ncbi:pyridoxamine 5'-phosphate oxidase family protein [Actinomadura keratinilytica]|jgi:nitroimidazol reductase NimA-like FMN-containing flavoprotein (pyridoxamine 5'-phosphate oxidase superfamily)|uniref:Pyridoxamine 5'-phosphate oxidase family protein n=1 Tax=Actinomadura keratinilytica TaxID=547461 RepID=A0ABP7YFB4_9ACTN
MNTATGGGGGAVLEELDREECLRLITPGGVGRVAFNDGEGPAVIPVNYVVDDGTVVFRTDLSSRLSKALSTALAGAQVRIAFEVDRFDEARHEGWSVLLRGGARQLSEDESAAAAPVEPWPGGERGAHIRMIPAEISGRRVHH